MYSGFWGQGQADSPGEKVGVTSQCLLKENFFFINCLCKVRQPQDDVRLLTDMIAEQIRDSWNLGLSGNEGTGMYPKGITAPGRCVYAGAEKQFYP